MDRCNFNIYNSEASECDEPHGSYSLSLQNLYTKRSKKTEVIHEALTIEISSKNRVLSHRGPDSAASLVASCGPQRQPFVKLVFPGYPMFVENNFVNVTMVFGNTRKYDFNTEPGNDMFEMVVQDQRVIRQISSSLRASSPAKVSFLSKDQEGSLIKADFNFTDFGPQISTFENTCL